MPTNLLSQLFSLHPQLLLPKSSVRWLKLEHFPVLLDIVEDNQWSLRNNIGNSLVSKKTTDAESLELWIYCSNHYLSAAPVKMLASFMGSFLGWLSPCKLQCSDLGEAGVDLDWGRHMLLRKVGLEVWLNVFFLFFFLKQIQAQHRHWLTQLPGGKWGV